MSVSIVVDQLEKAVVTAAGGLRILKGISFEIKPTQTVAIVGASGSGKSTLLGLLAGLDLPTAGTVKIDDVTISSLDEDGRAALRAEKVGFVFQSFQLLPGLTALENVMLPLEIKGVAAAQDQAQALLARVGLDQRHGHYPRAPLQPGRGCCLPMSRPAIWILKRAQSSRIWCSS
jgi:putative ABC transport system ATP-binding protein